MKGVAGRYLHHVSVPASAEVSNEEGSPICATTDAAKAEGTVP